MRTEPTTIVIAAPNALSASQSLTRLQAVRRPGDQVILVVPPEGHIASTMPLQTTRSTAVRVMEGTALAFWHYGALAVCTTTAVFLDARVQLSPHWLEPLLRPLDDPRVAACGPRIPALDQPRDPELRARLQSVAQDRRGLRDELRAWQAERHSDLTAVPMLHLACVAVRADALYTAVPAASPERFGTWEVGNLSDLADVEGRQYRCDAALGTLDDLSVSAWLKRPLVSACLIVRDEEENLGACLASVAGLADEVVVYDTGSTDDTISIARATGAKVVEGYWDEDFARARNDAKELCTGRWILWIDADERVIGDKAAVRRRILSSGHSPEGYNVTIENLMGSGAGARGVHIACRLFQREVGHWESRLHEQVQGPGGRALAPVDSLDDIRLEHLGYLDTAMQGRDKVNRNVRMAQAELLAPGVDRSYALMNLGRSLQTAGRFLEAVQACEESIALTTNPTILRVALRTGSEALVSLGQTEDALKWIARLRTASRQSVLPDVLQARVHATRGEFQQALDLLSPLTTTRRDDDGFEYTAEAFAAERARVLEALGKPSDAADTMLMTLRERGVLDAHLGKLVECLQTANRNLEELGRAAPVSALQFLVAQALQLPPLTSDDVLRALHEAHPEDLRPLAGASGIAPRLSVDRAMFWSARLRQRGLVTACPLRAIAADSSAPALTRLQAAAVAYGAFDDNVPLAAARELLAGAEHQADLLAAVHRLSPQFAGLLATVTLS